MNRLPLIIILICMVFATVACTSHETVKREIVLPDNLPEFVQQNDFLQIDWDEKAVKFGDRGIIGNENKSGVIADMLSVNGQKWMWHLWGVENPENKKLTVVGYHKETGTVHQILRDAWNKRLAGPNNGADAHTPSSVKIPKAGEWSILLYTDDKLFDTLIFNIKE